MSPWLLALLFALTLFLSAVYSGSETGMYTLSRVRLRAEVEGGRRSARSLQWLLKDETALLVTLLVGNNLMIELTTHLADAPFARVPSWARELVVAATLTPVVFFFAELLPKDLFRQRPNRLLTIALPLLALSRAVYLPLTAPLRWVASGLEHLLGVRERELTRALAREQVLEILREGKSLGAIPDEAEALAHNALALRETPVERVLVAWNAVEHLDLDASPAEQRAAVATASRTRLPVVRTVGGARRVVGYVHQLEVLSDLAGAPSERVRPLPVLAPDVAVDRALHKLRLEGQRLALVGTPDAPRGIVSLGDLVDLL